MDSPRPTLRRKVTHMKMDRRSFLELIGGLGVSTLADTHRGLEGTKVRLPTWEFPDEELFQWLKRPRIPVLESPDPVAQFFVGAMFDRGRVEFNYDGGSEPGMRRVVSPGLIFELEEGGPVYFQGYCHTRNEERIFRMDRVQTQPPLTLVG